MARAVKQCTSILPMPVLETLDAHLLGRDSGYIFEGRDQRHISTRQIEATDGQIDALVYELYGLTEEEIRIVGGRLLAR